MQKLDKEMYDYLYFPLYSVLRSKARDEDLIQEVISATFFWFFESGRHKEFNSKDWDSQKEHIRRLLFSRAKYSFLEVVTGQNKGWSWYKEVMAEDLKPASDEAFDGDFLATIATVNDNQDNSILCDQLMFYVNRLKEKEREAIVELAQGGTPITIATDWKWKLSSVIRLIDVARSKIQKMIAEDMGELDDVA